jgi:hypothetical protein
MISHRTPRPPTPLQCVASLVSQGAQIASIIHSPPFVLIQERAGPAIEAQARQTATRSQRCASKAQTTKREETMKRRHSQTNHSKRGGSIQNLAPTATVAADQSWPAPATTNPRRLSITPPPIPASTSFSAPPPAAPWAAAVPTTP